MLLHSQRLAGCETLQSVLIHQMMLWAAATRKCPWCGAAGAPFRFKPTALQRLRPPKQSDRSGCSDSMSFYFQKDETDSVNVDNVMSLPRGTRKTIPNPSGSCFSWQCSGCLLIVPNSCFHHRLVILKLFLFEQTQTIDLTFFCFDLLHDIIFYSFFSLRLHALHHHLQIHTVLFYIHPQNIPNIGKYLCTKISHARYLGSKMESIENHGSVFRLRKLTERRQSVKFYNDMSTRKQPEPVHKNTSLWGDINSIFSPISLPCKTEIYVVNHIYGQLTNNTKPAVPQGKKKGHEKNTYVNQEVEIIKSEIYRGKIQVKKRTVTAKLFNEYEKKTEEDSRLVRSFFLLQFDSEFSPIVNKVKEFFMQQIFDEIERSGVR
ncbi:hypothetical protein VP01_1135g3 [Puccinia sorghi]|uniref:Uncharacterized protein n=1 Tax=Puccinia sorghi TaxID=27349 RepID=A0A0L6VTG7_9BASI|nr:hypothetical protein VP01_1135g3 [Puccinia sorghi]